MSPSRLEAWDRCPRAYFHEYVRKDPAPEADQRPRLVGLAGHAILARYLQECVDRGLSRQRDRLPEIARALSQGRAVSAASTGIYREALSILTPFVTDWEVPVQEIVAVEQRFALDQANHLADWRAAGVWLRGVADLIAVRGRAALCTDWKSGWLAQNGDEMRYGWAPGLYGALIWRWAPRLEQVVVSYRYLRTGLIREVEISREQADETLEWARTTGTVIAQALAHPEDPEAFPAQPSTGCNTCPWVNRCPDGQAALAAVGEEPITSDEIARREAGLLLTGEARVARRRERLKQYLADRPPLALSATLQVGFFPSMGRYDPDAVAAALREIGEDSLDVVETDNRMLARLFRKHPGLRERLSGTRRPAPPWFGHRKGAA